MDLQLTGKKALVTGSSSGIGESIAKALAKEGVIVMVHGRNEKEIDRVADDIQKEGKNAYKVLGDLGNDKDAKKVAKETLDKLGDIDILVNNAGAFYFRGWQDTTPSEWLEIYNQNVVSAVRLILEFLPQMRKKSFGRFIQLGSCIGAQPFASMADYSSTKIAHNVISVSLAKELRGTGVTANTISPGPILTHSVKEHWEKTAKEKGWGANWDEIEKKAIVEVLPNPCNRFGRCEEIAHACAFIASPLANYINGANIRVDGGGSISIN